MIVSFKSKGLQELWTSGRTSRIDARFHQRILVRLDALEQALGPEDLNVPGFNFHMLRGGGRRRYTLHVNGPWCITFSFDDGDAGDVDFEQYH